MKTHEAIRHQLDTAHMVLRGYLEDFEDKDILFRPAPEANHIAWQMGHMISSEHGMIEGIRAGIAPSLPDGFSENHSADTAKVDDPSKFLSKNEYLALGEAQRTATLSLLEQLSESDLDAPGPESMQSIAPTVGAVIMLQGIHELMHAGQFIVVRRALGKPIIF